MKNFETSPILKTPHAFSTRYGGVSDGHFKSLNLGFTFGDELKNVAQNWKIFGETTGINVTNLCCTNQIHQANVAIVDSSLAFNPTTISDLNESNVEDNNKKIIHDLTRLQKTQYGISTHSSTQTNDNSTFQPIIGHDGLVTNDPSVTLAIFTADCGCLLMHDPVARVIGAAHCGWKGTVADIMKNTIEQMKILGATEQNITAALGPCINECCFEVGAEVVPYFDNLLGNEAKQYYVLTDASSQKYHINLRGAIEGRLIQLGLSAQNIGHIDECTVCNSNKYFSYRAEKGKTGRLAHIITLP